LWDTDDIIQFRNKQRRLKSCSRRVLRLGNRKNQSAGKPVEKDWIVIQLKQAGLFMMMKNRQLLNFEKSFNLPAD
jgi:hypothetical protein